MREKPVTRYICEFCGKTGYSKGHMRKHEAHCTKNPNRLCRMCDMDERKAPTPELLALMVAVVPKIGDYMSMTDDGMDFIDDSGAAKAIKEVWPRITEGCHECPACIMAVLRQAGFPLPIVSSFWTYSEACKEFWNKINKAKMCISCY